MLFFLISILFSIYSFSDESIKYKKVAKMLNTISF